jgi:hypothetical protein
VVSIEIIHNWTPRPQLLHDRLFSHCTVMTTDVIGFFNTSYRGTTVERRAAIFLCVSFIRSTFFVYSIKVFKEKSLENRPTTLATLVQKVALEKVLSRQIFCLSKPDSDTRL